MCSIFFHENISPACCIRGWSQPDPRIDPGYGPLHPYIHRGSVRVLQETSGHRAADWRRRADRGGQHGLGSYWTCMSVFWVFIMAYCICIWISLHRSPFVPLRYQEPPRAPGLACVPILQIYTRRCAVRRRWLWAWWTHTSERGWSGFDSSRRTWPYCCHRCPLPVCTARKHCSRYRLDHPTQSVGSKQFIWVGLLLCFLLGWLQGGFGETGDQPVTRDAAETAAAVYRAGRPHFTGCRHPCYFHQGKLTFLCHSKVSSACKMLCGAGIHDI